MTTTYDVVVVGAGLAGLAAGATAAAGGARTVVLDAHRPGGRARTFERDGYVFNHGAHALYLGGAGLPVLHSLGVRPEGAAPDLARYRMSVGGRLHAFPAGAATLARTGAVGVKGKLQLGRLLATLPKADPAPLVGTSAADWIAGFDLRPDAAAVLQAVLRTSTYTTAFDDLDAAAAVAQLQMAVAKGVIYLHGGWRQLTDALASRVEVHSGTKVRALELGPGATVVVADAADLLHARSVIVATGTPDAARNLLPADPHWGDLGEPVTAACLDLGLPSALQPRAVVAADAPLYAAVQSPPARQAPLGCSVVGVIRYGARGAEADRADLEAHARLAGADPDQAVERRFLARMVVAGAQPRAATGGLQGRPPVTATGCDDVLIAGDWVGPTGLLADAALASGAEAARVALRRLERTPLGA